MLPNQKEKLENELTRTKNKMEGVSRPLIDKYQNIYLRLGIPEGKLSDIVRMINYIKSVFNQVKAEVEISARIGEMEKSDYEDKIKEAINQANIIIEEEKIE